MSLFPIRSSFPAGAERERGIWMRSTHRVVYIFLRRRIEKREEKKRNERTSGSSSSRLSTNNENGWWFPPPIILCRSSVKENEVKKDVPCNNEKSDAIFMYIGRILCVCCVEQKRKCRLRRQTRTRTSRSGQNCSGTSTSCSLYPCATRT